MTQAASDRSTFAPDGWHTVTPRIVTGDPKGLVDFLIRVFDASGGYRETGPSEMRIGDSIVMVSETGVRPATGAFLYVYVRDTDATYRLAVAAGAAVVEEPSLTPYGDRRCMVEDAWGNTWQIATRSIT